jgi:6-phosphogluconolactonase (cycloisomerase 2 family)
VGLALDPYSRYAYVVTGGGSDTIASFTLNAVNGQLVPVPAPAATGASPSAPAADPLGRFVWLVNTTLAANNVQSYVVSGTGALVAGPVASAGTNPSALAAHPSGSFVYVANAASNNISGFVVAAGGALVPLAKPTFITGSGPAAIAMDPAGVFAYVLNLGSSDLWAYTVDPGTGNLSTVPGSPFPVNAAGASVLALDPLRRFVFAMSSTQVTAFALNPSTGTLTSQGPALPLGPGMSAGTSMIVDPSGRFSLFMGTAGGVTVALSSELSSAATFTPETFQGTRGAVSVAMTQSTVPVTDIPQFAYATSSGGAAVSGFSITAGTGVLNSLGAAFPAGTSPASIAVDPYERFAYVANNAASQPVSTYTIYPGYGLLVPVTVPAPPVLNSATKVAVDSSGLFAYVANGAGITPFPITQASGALGAPGVAVAGTIFTPDSLGRFLLAVNGGSVSAYPINPTTGALGAPTNTGLAGVTAIGVGPSGRFAFLGHGTALEAYTVSSTGALTLVNSLAGVGYSSIAVDSTETFVYATAATSGVRGCSINPITGTIADVPSSPFTTGGQATSSMALDPSGLYGYAVATGPGALWAWTKGGLGGGQLLGVPGAPYGTVATPTSVAVAGLFE